MQSFILVRALWPNDILERSRADTVAPCEIAAIINPGMDSSLIRRSHKRRVVHKTRKHCQLASILSPTRLRMWGIKLSQESGSHKPAICHIAPSSPPSHSLRLFA